MDEMEKQMIRIVNKNHECRRIMEKIDRDLYYTRFANRLRKISDRRRK